MVTARTLRLIDTAHDVLRREHRVAHLQRFLEAGLTRDQVGHLRHVGAVLRPRIGWYADPNLPDAAIRAVRVGGVLGCVSAAASWGIVVPEGSDRLLHVGLAPNAARLRDSRNPRRRAPANADHEVRRHWEAAAETPDRWRVSPLDAILQMAACVEYRWLVAAIDSARCATYRSPLFDTAQTSRLRELLPAHLKRAVDDSDARAESSGETFIRLGVRATGIPVEPQVWLTRRFRADLLVDGWLPVESDGRENHTGVEAVERDRERDACLALLGRPPLRFTQKQAVRETAFVVDTIRATWLRGRAAQEIRGDTPRASA